MCYQLNDCGMMWKKHESRISDCWGSKPWFAKLIVASRRILSRISGGGGTI